MRTERQFMCPDVTGVVEIRVHYDVSDRLEYQNYAYAYHWMARRFVVIPVNADGPIGVWVDRQGNGSFDEYYKSFAELTKVYTPPCMLVLEVAKHQVM